MARADIYRAKRAASGCHTPVPSSCETDKKKRKERSPAHDENEDKRNRNWSPIALKDIKDRNDQMVDCKDHEEKGSLIGNENIAQMSGVK